jgi:tetratricopeptide (TPR) repeat protein
MPALPPIDVNWVVAIATILGTLVAALAWSYSREQGRRSEITALVSKEVEAKIGGTLLNLKELEEQVRSQLQKLIVQVEQKQTEILADFRNREVALQEVMKTSSATVVQIDELINRANLIMPIIEQSEVVPRRLYFAARGEEDLSAVTALLYRILEHPDSDSKTLEFSGDLARSSLDNIPLALRLYERAISMDENNISARSEHLRLLATTADKGSKAVEELATLAAANPSEEFVLNNTINAFIARGEYAGLYAFLEQQLPKAGNKSLIWRNIAVAKTSLGHDYSDIRQAYEQAFSQGDDDDYVNAARPLVDLLINRGELEEALSIVHKAIDMKPSQAILHRQRGIIYRRLGQLEMSKFCYEWYSRLGNQEAKLIAANELRDFELRSQLKLPPGNTSKPIADTGAG